MPLHPIDPASLKINPFTLIGKDWALLSAGDASGFNTMTVSWGNVGVMWNKNIVTVFVRPQRYTKTFIDRTEQFTLSFYEESFRPALRLCGSKSGKTCDKAAEAGLTPVFENGTVYFEEARLVLECRKLYTGEIHPEGFLADEISGFYPEKDYHIVYMGEVLRVLSR